MTTRKPVTLTEMFFVAMVVGLVEFAPGMCRMELLNPDLTLHSFEVKCADATSADNVTIPWRAPYGP